MKNDPSGNSAVKECSLLLSMIFVEPPSFASSPMRRMLYERKLNVSKDCISAADAMYIFAPDFLYHRESAQASDPAQAVFPCFRGTNTSASWKRTISVPASLNPTRLYIINFCHGSNRNGVPRNGVPSSFSPC